MRIKLVSLQFILSLLLITTGVSAQTPAFPGAEGAGKYVTGGRGGKVLYVTSLDDSEEEGTLRWAIRKKGPRTILFKVSGLIELKSPLKINNGDLTIAGQSAPGDGICISNFETVISADNVIIRFLRFRLGDREGRAVDALSGIGRDNIIIDHCSMSWGTDENSSFYDNRNFTMQWCFITESLRNSVHTKGKHGYGGIWGGQNASFHHNLIAHNDSRNPRFCGSRYSNRPELEKVDFWNNLLYNWGANNIYAAEGGNYNIINNYYKPGPASGSSAKKRFINPDADNGQNNQPEGIYGQFFLSGNILEGNSEATKENNLAVEMGSSFQQYAPEVTLKDILADNAFPLASVTTDAAHEAYEKVLAYGGCSLERDIHDERYVQDVKEGSYTFEGSAGSTKGLIDSQEDVGGWTEYKTYREYRDSDSDGIPEGWLDENFPGRKATDLNSEGYSYLEVYLHSLVAHLMGSDIVHTGETRKTDGKQVKRIVVDQSGKGDFTTLQAAINSVRAFDPDFSTTIFVKEGIYYEKIIIPDYLRDLTITGENREKTIISNNDHALINQMGTFKTYTLQVRGSDITLKNLTIENNAPMVAQAVALHTEGDRIMLINCRLLGNQDTVYTGGENARLYFRNCDIEGTTDFIFGPSTAWFENCRIHCKKNSYITAASTPEEVEYGYIFNHCKITAADDVTSVYLGRPWRPYAMTLFMHCELPQEINPLGWDNWHNPENEKTARYAEYNNSGEGGITTHRVGWMKSLTPAEAEKITVQSVMGDFYAVIGADVVFREDPANRKIDILINDLFFTSFIYPDMLEKPTLFPIVAPSGKQITRGYPLAPRPNERTDHPHHVGLWFNFGDVNGIDFWNNSSAVPPGRKQLYGSIRLDAILETDSRKGALTTRSSWVDYQGNRLLSENTTYIFSGTGNEYRSVERVTALTAVEAVTMKGNKEGLFALRVDKAFEEIDGLYRNHEGLKGESEVWGRRTPWVALSAETDGEIITIVMLDHEKNINYPGWPHARGYGLFSMNNLGGDAMDKTSPPVEVKLAPGETITFRHKMIIGGEMSDEEINSMLSRFNDK